MIIRAFECQHCGSSFERPFNGGTFLYCGNACKVASFRKANPGRVKQHRRTEVEKRALLRKPYLCRDCGVEVPMRRRICDDCKVKPPTQRYCACGSAIDTLAHHCDPCRAERTKANRARAKLKARGTEAHKRRKRTYRVWRKAKERGAEAERFDPIEVLRRDRWRCHLCGVSTPERLRGTFDDRAPELDHIVPLAAGGEHSRRNTACACRKCNLAKGDKPLGQTRLVA